MQILSYGPFHDFPRGLYTHYKNHIFSLDSDFNDDLDDYNDFFTIMAVPGASAEDFYTGRFYYNMKQSNRTYYPEIPLGVVKTSEVFFDSSRRKSFRSPVFEMTADQYLTDSLETSFNE